MQGYDDGRKEPILTVGSCYTEFTEQWNCCNSFPGGMPKSLFHSLRGAVSETSRWKKECSPPLAIERWRGGTERKSLCCGRGAYIHITLDSDVLSLGNSPSFRPWLGRLSFMVWPKGASSRLLLLSYLFLSRWTSSPFDYIVITK